ncbi:MAG: hypothetical protein IH872_12365 [Chloroflexi bacterium]|nr:hypothetical protein [Chloroflexota bacterium]
MIIDIFFDESSLTSPVESNRPEYYIFGISFLLVFSMVALATLIVDPFNIPLDSVLTLIINGMIGTVFGVVAGAAAGLLIAFLGVIVSGIIALFLRYLAAILKESRLDKWVYATAGVCLSVGIALDLLAS